MADAVTHSRNLLAWDDGVLVVVDMQSRLLDAMPPALAETMLASTGKLLTAAGLLKLPVLLTEQYPKGLGATAAEILKLLPENAQCFEKTAFSCCGSEAFDRALAATGRRQVILTGQEAHVCVLQTAIDLLNQGFDVHVVEDAICSRRELHKHNALARLRQFGVTVSNHESVLFECLRDAKHPHFKTISALLR